MNTKLKTCLGHSSDLALPNKTVTWKHGNVKYRRRTQVLAYLFQSVITAGTLDLHNICFTWKLESRMFHFYDHWVEESSIDHSGLWLEALTHLDKQLPSICHVVTAPPVVFNHSDQKGKKVMSERVHSCFHQNQFQLSIVYSLKMLFHLRSAFCYIKSLIKWTVFSEGSQNIFEPTLYKESLMHLFIIHTLIKLFLSVHSIK